MCRTCRFVKEIYVCCGGLLQPSTCDLRALGICPNALPPLAPTPQQSPVCDVPILMSMSSHCSTPSYEWEHVVFVLVLLCWEWWFPASYMFLQRTWSHPFLWLHSIPWCTCARFSLSSIFFDGHLGWFQVFAIVNSATINIRVHVSL